MIDCLFYIFYLINFLMMVTGIFCITFVVWFSSISILNKTVHQGKQHDLFFFFSIGIGSALIITAMLGSFALHNKKKSLLKIYILMVLLFSSSELIAFIYTFTEGLPTFVDSLFVVWNAANHKLSSNIQFKFSCCGYFNASEWEPPYPKSCLNVSTSMNTTLLSSVWKKSCSTSILNWLSQNMAILASTIVFIFIVQVLQIIFSTIIIQSMNVFLSRRDSLQQDVVENEQAANSLHFKKPTKLSIKDSQQWLINDGSMEYIAANTSRRSQDDSHKETRTLEQTFSASSEINKRKSSQKSTDNEILHKK